MRIRSEPVTVPVLVTRGSGLTLAVVAFGLAVAGIVSGGGGYARSLPLPIIHTTRLGLWELAGLTGALAVVVLFRHRALLALALLGFVFFVVAAIAPIPSRMFDGPNLVVRCGTMFGSPGPGTEGCLDLRQGRAIVLIVISIPTAAALISGLAWKLGAYAERRARRVEASSDEQSR